ncbi:MAG: sulfite exporter TauE/SafE family protein [Myxococcales bacterium]|nr:sulfite exporter TauE/SafE family protein [Myxococcales bacterium]
MSGLAQWTELAALGLGVGFLAGMFGVGGGFLLTPLLSVLFGLPLPIAVGVGLCQMIGTAVAALLRHRRLGHGEPRFDLLMLPGALLGVEAGARLLAHLESLGTVSVAGRPIAVVNLVAEASYAVLLLAVAAMFWREGRRGFEPLEYVRSGPLARIRLGPRVDLPRVPLRGVSALVIAYLGLALGVLSGLLGIGGGVALMPVLVYGYGFPLRQAAGTGLLLVVATATMGTFVHALRGHVPLELAAALLLGSTMSAQLGAIATRRVSARGLRRLFALVLVATVAAIGWDLWRRLG